MNAIAQPDYVAKLDSIPSDETYRKETRSNYKKRFWCVVCSSHEGESYSFHKSDSTTAIRKHQKLPDCMVYHSFTLYEHRQSQYYPWLLPSRS